MTDIWWCRHVLVSFGWRAELMIASFDMFWPNMPGTLTAPALFTRWESGVINCIISSGLHSLAVHVLVLPAVGLCVCVPAWTECLFGWSLKHIVDVSHSCSHIKLNCSRLGMHWETHTGCLPCICFVCEPGRDCGLVLLSNQERLHKPVCDLKWGLWQVPIHQNHLQPHPFFPWAVPPPDTKHTIQTLPRKICPSPLRPLLVCSLARERMVSPQAMKERALRPYAVPDVHVFLHIDP